ncbi:unnamed protein product [Mytilus coruscus]|uniref:Uncharacterized protein n=1 Tax=Mytilus coruscus TaxID=42192 RepID=A0A6J8DPU6_MYTCO|nr:unnamed protein product [Mytilus coruscus]
MSPPNETLIITSRAKQFLLLTLNSLHYLIITMIGSVNEQAIEIKQLKNSVLVYDPSESIRRKILSLNKHGKFQIKVTKFDTDHRKKITIEAAATKEKNENKVTKNRVYKVIPKPVDTEILNIKKQENILRQSSLGHYAKQCRKSINTCIKCAGKHATKNCNDKTIKCNNCGGKNQAIDKSCPKYIFQKQVLENMYSYKMSFQQAKQKAQQKGETIPKIISSQVSKV